MANRIVKGLSWTMASSIIRNLVSLLQLAILTRFLEKSDFGIVAIAHLFVNFTAMFLDMGISTGIIHRQKISNNEYSSLFWLNVSLGATLTLALFSLAPFVTAGYNSPDLTKVLQLICFSIFLSSLGAQQRTYCKKKAYFGRLAVIEIIGATITMAVAVACAATGHGVYSLAYSTLAGSVFGNLTHLVIGLIKDSRLHFHFSFLETKPFLKIGAYQLGSQILDFFTQELDVIIISTTLGLEFLGVYNIAKRVPSALYSFIQPVVHTVFAPLLAEIQSDLIKLKQNYMMLSKALSWISFPMYLFLAAISPTVISIVFGADYIEGVPVMMVFCLKYAFNGVNGVCGALQTALGRTDIGLKWTIYLIVSTASVYYFTSCFGIIVFLVGICALTFINVFMVWYIQFRPMVKVSFAEYLTIYTKSFFICTFLSILVFVIYHESSLVYSIITCIVYAILFVYLLINTSDGRYVVDALKLLRAPERAVVIVEQLIKK